VSADLNGDGLDEIIVGQNAVAHGACGSHVNASGTDWTRSRRSTDGGMAARRLIAPRLNGATGGGDRRSRAFGTAIGDSHGTM